jgi:hypothetical protein
MCRCISAIALLPYLTCYYPLHIILFLHLLSTNHKCTQPCYFPLLYKPAAQKVNLVMKNSSTRMVQKVVLDHNHFLASPNKRHMLRSQRRVLEADKKLISQIREVGMKPA